MPIYAAFLRSINVGKRRVKMQTLSALCEGMGLTNVTTILASGNLVFRSNKRTAASVETLLERELTAGLGFHVESFVRTARELTRVARTRPFEVDEHCDPVPTLQVAFFREPIPKEAIATLADLQTPTDRLHVDTHELYWLRYGRISDSELWNSKAVFQLKLPSMTFRTMDTVCRMELARQKEKDTSH